MNKYPQLLISKEKLEHNFKIVKNMCDSKDIEIAAVTKVYCGLEEITKIFVKNGAEWIADSRLENLEKYQGKNIKKLLLRIPMLSETKKIVQKVDAVLISELITIEKINKVATKKIGVIIMIDLGDLREGIFDVNELENVVGKVLELKNIELLGFGTNLSCYGGILPEEKNMNHFIKLIEKMENQFNFKSKIISGGNSGILSMIDTLPKRVNQIRVGASITAGIGLNDEPIKNAFQDAFKLEVEVIEIKMKPSIPIGNSGLNAFGEKPYFEDNGNIKHVICAIGRQDVQIEDIEPIDKDIKILGASSDHLILDITQSKSKIQLGSIITFNLSYGGILSLSTSEYVNKKIS